MGGYNSREVQVQREKAEAARVQQNDAIVTQLLQAEREKNIRLQEQIQFQKNLQVNWRLNLIKAEQIREEQIKEQKIRDEQITAQKIRDEKIKAQQILDVLIKAQQIREEKIKAQQIRDEQITAQKIRDEKIKAQRIQDELIKAQQILNEQIKAQQIRDEQIKEQNRWDEIMQDMEIRAEQIKAQQNREARIKAQQIRNEQFKAQKIRDEQIKAQQIRDEQIKAQHIQAEQIKAQQIRNEQIKAEKIQAEQIKAEQIRDEQIKAQQIQYEQIKAQQIRASRIKAEDERKMCSNVKRGCTNPVPFEQMIHHSRACLYRPYRCPMKPCSWRGNYNELFSHAEEVHITCTGMRFGQHNRVLLGPDVMLLTTKGLVFKFYARPTQPPLAMCWAVQLLGPRAVADQWKYQIYINKEGNHVKRLQLSDTCLCEDEDVEEVLDEGRCPSAAFKMLENYLQNNRFGFKLNIYNKSKLQA